MGFRLCSVLFVLLLLSFAHSWPPHHFCFVKKKANYFLWRVIFLCIKKPLSVFLLPAARPPSLDQLLFCLYSLHFQICQIRAVVSCTEYYRTCSYMPILVYKVELKMLHLAGRSQWVVVVCHRHVTKVGCPAWCVLLLSVVSIVSVYKMCWDLYAEVCNVSEMYKIPAIKAELVLLGASLLKREHLI